MDIRVTPQSLLQNALAQLSRQTSQLGRIQEQAGTGKRINRPSDQPADLPALIANQAQDKRFDLFQTTIVGARSTLDVSNSILQEANALLTQARNIALEGSQSTNDNAARASLAQEIDGLLDRLVNLANTQHAGRYLFAGAATSTAPFVVTAADGQGRPLTIAYQGADQAGLSPVGPRQTIRLFDSGEAIFQARQRGTTLYTGATGAAAGTALDSATGQGELLVQHTTTSYAGGSGVQLGMSSAVGDTIIGPAGAHTLTIIDTSGTGAFGTVALDGGTPVAFTSADTNLQVAGANGAVVFIDTSAITPAFNGTIAITANGTLSMDGGATTMPINFSANQVITDSVTGAITNVNSTNIRQTGTSYLDYVGATDAFQVLMGLRDELRNTRGLPEGQQLQAISRRIADIDFAREGILNAVGDQSATLQNLDSLEKHYQDVQLATKQFISDLSDADLSEVVVQLQAQQNLMQLTLGVTARLFDQNLLDFLR